MLNTKRTQTKQICRFFPLTANTKLPCVRKIIAIPPFANHHSLYAEISSNDTIFYCLAPSFKPTCHLEASGAALVASQCQVTALWQQGKCTPALPGSCPTCSQPALHFLSGHWCCGGSQCFPGTGTPVSPELEKNPFYTLHPIVTAQGLFCIAWHNTRKQHLCEQEDTGSSRDC